MAVPSLAIVTTCVSRYQSVGDVRIIDESEEKDDGWQRLVEGDFENVNGEADTWSWKVRCSGLYGTSLLV